MKKFRHKTLGWIAEGGDDGYYLYKYIGVVKTKTHSLTPKELIEADSNREEVVETDWIDECIEYYFKRIHTKPAEESLRESIEKHAPKMKKLTGDDVRKYMTSLTLNEQTYLNGNFLREFLRAHGLYVKEE